MHHLYFLATYEQRRKELEDQLRIDRMVAAERAGQRRAAPPKRRRRRLSLGRLTSRQAY